MNTENKVLDPKLSGYIAITCINLRNIALIELRQGFEKGYDNTINFYLDKMDTSVYSRNIDLKKFERIQKLSKHYVEYSIYYSFSDKLEIKNELSNSFDYLVVYKVEDVVRSFHNILMDFYESNHSGCFCKKRDLKKLLKIPRENFLELEIGNLEEL